MQCAASRPGGSATHAAESRYWVSAPSLLQCPERQETWDEDPDRRSRMPSPRCLLLPQALRRGPGCLFWETCRGWEPGPGTSGLQAGRAALQEGKWKSGSVGSLSRRVKEGRRVGGRRQNRSRVREREARAGEEERGRQVPRKAQPLDLSLGCIFIRSRGCTDGLSIEFHLQHHQRLILYSLLILP